MLAIIEPDDKDLVQLRARMAGIRAVLARGREGLKPWQRHTDDPALTLELEALTRKARHQEWLLAGFSTIVSNNNRKEIQAFLHSRGFRWKKSGFEIKGWEHYQYLNRGRIALYRATGDANLTARRDIAARITFGDLALVLIGQRTLQALIQESQRKNLEVPCKALV